MQEERAGGEDQPGGREGQCWAGRAKLQPEEGQGQQGDILGGCPGDRLGMNQPWLVTWLECHCPLDPDFGKEGALPSVPRRVKLLGWLPGTQLVPVQLPGDVHW